MKRKKHRVHSNNRSYRKLQFSGVDADAPKNDKDMYGLRYGSFVVPLVKAVQEQQSLIRQLQAEIEELKKKMGN